MTDRADDPLRGIAPHRIARFLAGEMTPGEEAGFRRDITASGGDASVLDLLRKSARAAARDAERSVDADVEWRALTRRLPDLGAHAATRIPIRARATQYRWLAGIAAVTLVAAGLDLIARTGGRPALGAREYATRVGQRETVTLADGTRFVLGPASRIRVPATYGVNERTVMLDGEAYFAVRHDARTPFTVRTARSLVQDVGTVFTVSAYADDPTERVAVVEGRVGIRPVGAASLPPRMGGKDVAAAAGDVAVIGTSVAVTHGVDVGALTAWTDGRLTFRETPLAEVARNLARWYDFDVSVPSGAIGTLPLTATFTTEPVDDVLSVVATTLGLRVERTGRHVEFVRGTRPSPPLSTSR